MEARALRVVTDPGCGLPTGDNGTFDGAVITDAQVCTGEVDAICVTEISECADLLKLTGPRCHPRTSGEVIGVPIVCVDTQYFDAWQKGLQRRLYLAR